MQRNGSGLLTGVCIRSRYRHFSFRNQMSFTCWYDMTSTESLSEYFLNYLSILSKLNQTARGKAWCGGARFLYTLRALNKAVKLRSIALIKSSHHRRRRLEIPSSVAVLRLSNFISGKRNSDDTIQKHKGTQTNRFSLGITQCFWECLSFKRPEKKIKYKSRINYFDGKLG